MVSQGRRNDDRNPFNKPSIVGSELIYVGQAVAGGHASGDGPFTRRAQKLLEDRFGAERVLLTTSCTAALEMAALLCGLGPGDEVILPSYTFVSTANAVVLRGATPVFVDIRPDTLNIDERLIEAAITPRTRAIFPVHYAGVACEMDEIMAIAGRHNLLVVEDAAQGVFAKYKDRWLGTIGHLGCYSFHETKNFSCGEGGALVVNDRSLEKRAEILREKGTNRSQFLRGQADKYTWVDVGSSYVLSDMLAAFLLGQLENMEKITARRRSDLRTLRRHARSARRTRPDRHSVRAATLHDQPSHVLYPGGRSRGTHGAHRAFAPGGHPRGLPLCAAALLAVRPVPRRAADEPPGNRRRQRASAPAADVFDLSDREVSEIGRGVTGVLRFSSERATGGHPSDRPSARRRSGATYETAVRAIRDRRFVYRWRAWDFGERGGHRG